MPLKLNPVVRKFIKVGLPLFVGVIILYFLYKGTDFKELWLNIKDVHWGILLFSLIFGLLGNVIRGFRWELLINPLGYAPKKLNLVYAVLGNYAVNFVLPRAGEIWRCGAISKEEKIPFTKLIGTLIIDRLFDSIMVLLFLLVTFLSNAALFYKNSDSFNFPTFLLSPYFYLSCIGSVLAIVLVLVLFKENKIIGKVWQFLDGIWKDMKTVWRMKRKTRFLCYTLGIWISYFFYFYVTFFAFGFTAELGVAAGLFVFTLSSISMVIPTNGGVGPWQAAVVLGLGVFLVSKEQAMAFATAVFTIQSIWVILCGLFGFVALSLKPKSTTTTTTTY